MKFIEVKTHEDDRVFEGKKIIINTSHIALARKLDDGVCVIMTIDGSDIMIDGKDDIRYLLLSTD